MEHARIPEKKSATLFSWLEPIGRLWKKKKGKAILLGAAAVVVALVVLLVWLLWPSVPTAYGNSGLAVQIGSKIYYVNTNDRYALYSMNTGGSENQKVLSSSIGELVTNGENLYAFINDEYRYVWDIDPESGSEELVIDTAIGEMEYANSYLIYTDLNQDRSLYSLYLSDTNVSTRLTELPAFDVCSDGEQVYFRYGRDGDYALCSVPLTGGEVTSLLPGKELLDLVYYQDKLYYVMENGDFCSVNPDGSEDTVICSNLVNSLAIFRDEVYFIYNGETEEQNGSLCRMKLDGSDLEVLAQGTYSSINVVEGRVFLLDDSRTWYAYDLANRSLSEV